MWTVAYQARTVTLRIPVPTLTLSPPGRQRTTPSNHPRLGTRIGLRTRRRDSAPAEHGSPRPADRIATATQLARDSDTARALMIRAGAGF